MRVILHICCAICAAGVVESLLAEGYEVMGFFCNPNIHPAEEYKKRLEAVRTVAKRVDFTLVEAVYTPEDWLNKTRESENEPEGGERCSICFGIRLKETYAYMLKCGGDAFTTTLTVSPHKPANTINSIGHELGGDRFLARDFKKKDGFKRAVELAKEWDIYRQNYCGCIYSMPSRRSQPDSSQ